MNNKRECFWESIGSPKTALAPMVDHCDLPFRILCHRYGCELSYTQMYNSKEIATSNTNLKMMLERDINQSLNSPCFIQLNGHDPEMLLRSAKLLQDKTPCIDINLGCPQQIAKRGHYGAFLLDHPDEVYKIIGYLCNNNLSCGVSCKIRLFNDLNQTFDLVKNLDKLGISCLCVHGRTKEENKEKIGPCNWEAIKEIKKLVKIPVIANGGLGTFEDIDKCLEYTGCDCVMSGEKLLEMPSYFSKKMYNIDDIATEYLDIWKSTYKSEKIIENNMSIIRGHMHKMFYVATKMDIRLNSRISHSYKINELYEVIADIREVWKDYKLEDKYGWYKRHQLKLEQKYPEEGLVPMKQKKEEEEVEYDLGDLF